VEGVSREAWKRWRGGNLANQGGLLTWKDYVNFMKEAIREGKKRPNENKYGGGCGG